MISRHSSLVLTLAVLATAGCGKEPYQLAPVSGQVKLNGKPLPKAWVHFAPKASKQTIAPGPTSHGRTDAEGRYTLGVDPEHAGAVVGPNRVFISTLEEGTGDAPDAGGMKTFRDRVPARYNQETKLVYEVRSGGSREADFDLKAP
jgi:hypothetical protein